MSVVRYSYNWEIYWKTECFWKTKQKTKKTSLSFEDIESNNTYIDRIE